MVQVCCLQFPKGTRKYQQHDGFYLDDNLKAQIDVLVKNIKNDWDFTIIISGEGEVRVGKSVLAMQIGAYWTEQMKLKYNLDLPFSVEQNLVFDGKKLIETGNKLGKAYPNSVLIYDEAGADLEGRKAMQSITQDVVDYFRECGQYNMLNILVLPEFFDLPKGIAMSRSIFLLNVFYKSDEEGNFERGYYWFYSKRNKKRLYLWGKKELDYSKVKSDFKYPLRFMNFYPVDEKKYRQAKQEALTKRGSRRRNEFQLQRDACWYLLWAEFGMTQEQIGKRMEGLTGKFVAQNTIHDGIAHYKVENE